eukprot:Skav200043  [mRNA]  locus=scaffold337:311768:312400:+ [translate_table: standard]
MENKRRRVAVDGENPPRAALKLQVSLPSGQSASVELPLDATVGDLKVAAQQSLGQRFLRFAGPDGTLLHPEESLQHAKLQDGDSISAIAQRPNQIAATRDAFALWCEGGDNIVTWGRPDEGGDNSMVGDQLKSVQSIQATQSAFASILADGSVFPFREVRKDKDVKKFPFKDVLPASSSSLEDEDGMTADQYRRMKTALKPAKPLKNFLD